MDLFSWIYEAPASRSSKSALFQITILSLLPFRPASHSGIACRAFIRPGFTLMIKLDTFDKYM
jgi:hypothetical protein